MINQLIKSSITSLLLYCDVTDLNSGKFKKKELKQFNLFGGRSEDRQTS